MGLSKSEVERLKSCVQKDALVDGKYYLGDCRNASIARWNGKLGLFFYTRHKFGSNFVESIKHPSDDNGYDLFWPTCAIEDYEIPKGDEEK